MSNWRTFVLLMLLSLAVLGAAMLFIPRLGIEADEATLGNGLYGQGGAFYALHVRGYAVPVMLISYVGALKTWLYKPWFLLFNPSSTTLRLPMAVLSAATVWLFFGLLDRVVGRRAAWIGAVLLATDTSYLLLTTIDFGAVTLQFVLKLSAMLLLMRFHQTRRAWTLASGFFLFGIALWDKAVFLWILFGLGVAVIVAFWHQFREHLTRGNVAIAVAATLLGAVPLEIYNAARHFATLRDNAKVSDREILHKADEAYRTVTGYVLFDFLTASDPGPSPGQPRSRLELWSLRLAEWTGHPEHNLTLWAVLFSLPFLWFKSVRRPMSFGLLVCAGTWLPMAATAGAGGAAHHAVLMWPFHLMVIATALSCVPSRVAVAATIMLSLANLAVTNQYYADLIRNGPSVRWTDAMDELNRYLLDARSEHIFTADWNLNETLNLISEGRLPISPADAADPNMLDHGIASPTALFVSHVPTYTYQPWIRAAIDDRARLQGYQEEILATISDLNGRPTFQVFRFHSVH